ncbi:MAG: hypothetical protein J6Z11_05480 [Candidatus Riflebacteria bacterium]|nr:hypothetical protein [Candidatus Riflebacteria bacterium]
MDANKNRKVLEALQMQPLSEEEKSSRHILGRLYGPIATCKEKTRNGRGYNKELWERALADEIFKEKLATKSLFLELGHPADREETDMTCVCACIPEMPKIVNDDLYAYVDILDTPNGKLLKTLCDYGFVPGISSRGSGDIMANDEVDPETFFLETWDIVQLPAVKKARLAMCESFDGKKPLKAVLQESYDAANDEDKKVMKESLENLDIKLNEEAETLPNGTPADPDKVPVDDEVEECLTEDAAEDEINIEDLPEAEEENEEAPVEEAPEALTVGAFIDELKDYDKDLSLEWKPIVIDDKEYPIEAVAFDNSEEGKIIASVSYVLPEEEPTIEDEVIEEPVEGEAEEAPEDASDAGDDEVIESLKEAVRQKDLLESEVKELRNSKTVSDAEVGKLKEELEKYKSGFARVSELASKSTSLEKENNSLKEQVNLKDTEIKDLKTKVENHISLTESVDADKAKINDLTEKLAKVQSEAEETEKSLNEQLSESRKKAQDRTALAKSYKAKYDAVVERYIANKASLLGVRPQDIKSRLNENYSLDDIDTACDGLLNEGRPQFGLVGGNPRVRVNESVSKKTIDPDNGYDVDDDLLILAGLK